MTERPIVLRSACIKLLSATEADPKKSHQHEFNGVAELEQIFGEDSFEREAIFSLRGESLTDKAKVTWYDARRKHPTRSEHRLYFRENKVMSRAREGDNILIGFDNANELHCVLIPSGVTGYRDDVAGWEVTADVNV
jgi:hypothetical protein